MEAGAPSETRSLEGALDLVGLAATLESVLGLCHPPVGILRMRSSPPGVSQQAESAAACRFWRNGERRLVFASAEAHGGCPVGLRVLGLAMSDTERRELDGAIQTMCEAGYLARSELDLLPSLAAEPHAAHQAAGILYGPLKSFTQPPDFVVMWLTPRAAMLVSEACGASRWDGTGGLLATGRPACAAIPRAESLGEVVVSLGCAGMRMRTGIDDELLLAVVPKDRLVRFVAEVRRAAQINNVMEGYYIDMARSTDR